MPLSCGNSRLTKMIINVTILFRMTVGLLLVNCRLLPLSLGVVCVLAAQLQILASE